MMSHEKDSLFNCNRQHDIYNSIEWIHYQVIIIVSETMDFISKNKVVVGIFTVASFIGAALYFGPQDQPKETALSMIPCQSQISDLKTVFTSKIFELKSLINSGQFNDEQLKEIVTYIITHIQAKTFQIDREDMIKTRELKDPNNFSVSVYKLVEWLKQKQLKIEELQQEQWQFINSLTIPQEQKLKINKEVNQSVKRQRINKIGSFYERLAQIYLVSKKNFLVNHGEKLASDLVEVCKSWSKENLKFVPTILNLIINQSIEDYQPELIDNQLEIVLAVEKFEKNLKPQIEAYQEVMGRLSCKIERDLLSRRSISD